MSVAACLIVKNGERTLRRCLESLAGVVDEVVVYDTGSSDGTVELARACGAIVVEGYWDDDFARARNAALAAVTADWVLSLDADEWVEADRPRLRELWAGLGQGEAVLGVHVLDAGRNEAGWYSFTAPRLFRRDGAVWTGRVHEQVDVDGTLGRCEPAILRLRHDGYADEAQALAKACRNVALGTAEVAELRADPAAVPLRLASALLDLGRSLVAADRQRDAVAVFDEVRTMAPESPSAVRATDHLVRSLLVTGEFGRVCELVDELRAAGAEPRYCDWLLAQALAQTGAPRRAVALLSGVDELVDPSGRTYDLGALVEFRSLTRALCGDLDGALRDLLVAMAGHGRVAGRGRLVREWWGPQPTELLVAAVRASGGAFAADAERELLAAS